MSHPEDTSHNINIYRCCFCIFVFVQLINTASSHVIIEGVEGESIILPCVHTNVKLRDEHLEVHWRHNDIRNVYDIIHGSVSVKEQDPAYKNRSSVELQECKTGDCSLKLKHLQRSDGGMYLCYVPAVHGFQKAELLVKKRFALTETSFREHRATWVSSHARETRLGLILHLIPVFGFILHIM